MGLPSTVRGPWGSALHARCACAWTTHIKPYDRPLRCRVGCVVFVVWLHSCSHGFTTGLGRRRRRYVPFLDARVSGPALLYLCVVCRCRKFEINDGPELPHRTCAVERASLPVERVAPSDLARRTRKWERRCASTGGSAVSARTVGAAASASTSGGAAGARTVAAAASASMGSGAPCAKSAGAAASASTGGSAAIARTAAAAASASTGGSASSARSAAAAVT